MPNQTRCRLIFGGLLTLVSLLGAACSGPPPTSVASPTVVVEHPPLEYACVRAPSPPEFTGDLDAGVWSLAGWTADFRDIEGAARPDPEFQTQVKMLWDETHLYVGCTMEEPDLWATYDQRDMIVFHEHDFEVFIDPDGDGNEYYEIEINVLGTIFDLFLHRPYRSGGPAEHGWDTSNLKFAIHTDGTINDPGDRDRGWTVELAIPFADLKPPSIRADGTAWSLPPITEHQRTPVPHVGETWRINFSRVEWDLEVVDGSYQKIEGRPEYNWTWTPQWEINMHVPERWGLLRFVAE
jgi:hypothetical protein